MKDDEFEELWESLSDNQKLVAQEYAFAPTKAEAARRAGLSPSTAYGWPDQVFEAGSALIDQRKDGIVDGLKSLSNEAVDAMKEALEGERELSRVEMEVAQYVIDQVQGKPTQKQEVEHSGGLDIDTEDIDQALDGFGGE